MLACLNANVSMLNANVCLLGEMFAFVKFRMERKCLKLTYNK